MCISNCIKHIISEFNAYYLWQSMHFFGSARLQAASSDLVRVSVGRQPWLNQSVEMWLLYHQSVLFQVNDGRRDLWVGSSPALHRAKIPKTKV